MSRVCKFHRTQITFDRKLVLMLIQQQQKSTVTRLLIQTLHSKRLQQRKLGEILSIKDYKF